MDQLLVFLMDTVKIVFILDQTCARSSTDRASDFGSEGSGFESLRAHL